LRRVRDEVGERHLARQNERHRTREQADQHQHPTNDFQDCREPDQRHQFDRKTRRGGKVEQFLQPMLHEQKGGDDAQNA